MNCRDEVSFADPEPGSTGRGELGGNDETSATYVEFGDRGHGTLAEPCSDQIVLQFLAAPALVPIEVDLSGVDQPSLRSSAPGEWYEFDDGVWYRDRSFLDHSS